MLTTKDSKNWTEIVRQTKEQEIIDLNKAHDRIFSKGAGTDFRNKQVALFSLSRRKLIRLSRK